MSDTAIQKNENTANAPERIEQETYFTPLVDIIETDDAFIFKADLPGVRAEDVDINFENGVLTLSAKVQPRQPRGTNYIWQEYGVGPFYRQFILRTPVNADGIQAELRNGELTLTVPKAESAKTHKIQIKTADQSAGTRDQTGGGQQTQTTPQFGSGEQAGGAQRTQGGAQTGSPQQAGS
jgi:HSP20 family molecular chaperone IbpA